MRQEKRNGAGARWYGKQNRAKPCPEASQGRKKAAEGKDLTMSQLNLEGQHISLHVKSKQRMPSSVRWRREVSAVRCLSRSRMLTVGGNSY